MREYNWRIPGVIPTYFRGVVRLTLELKGFKPTKPLHMVSFAKEEKSSELFYTTLYPHIEILFPQFVIFPTEPMAKYFCNMCGFIDTPHKTVTEIIVAQVVTPVERFGRCGDCGAPSEKCYGFPTDPLKSKYNLADSFDPDPPSSGIERYKTAPTIRNLTKKFDTTQELDLFNQARTQDGVFQL